jgi:hypothetical protein
MISLNQTESDDPNFIELVSQIACGAIECYEPDHVYVIQIDNWFDHKWKNFAGVTYLQLSVWRSDPLRVPPFDPDRVVNQRYFYKDKNSDFKYEMCKTRRVHKHQWSVFNLNRKLNRADTTGLYIWYSSNTVKNDRSSLMVYNTTPESSVAWYASFMKKEEWIVNKTKGISKPEFAGLLKISQPLAS